MSTITLTAKSKIARVSNGDTVVLPDITNLAAGFSVILQTAENSDVITVQPHSGQSIEHRLGSISKTNGLYGIKLVRNNSTDWSFISDFDLRDENHGDVTYPVSSTINLNNSLPLKITTTPITLTGSEATDIWIDITSSDRNVYLPANPADGKQYRIVGYQTAGYSTPYQAIVWGYYDLGGGPEGHIIEGNQYQIIMSNDVVSIKYDASSSTWKRVGGFVAGSNIVSQAYPEDGLGIHANVFQTHFFQDTGAVGLLTYGNYTSHMVRHANTTGGNVDYTLPTGIGIYGNNHTQNKVWIFIKRSAANLVTITTQVGETVGGAASLTLTEAGETIAIQDDMVYPNGDWKVLWHYKPSAVLPQAVWESASFDGVNAGTSVLAHTLGVTPKHIWFEGLCIADNSGWIAGERNRSVPIPAAHVDADASNIYIYWFAFTPDNLAPPRLIKTPRGTSYVSSTTALWTWRALAT